MNACSRALGSASPASAAQDLREAALLDEMEQLFFTLHVVVDARERDAAGGGQIAHAGGVVAPLREHAGGSRQQGIEALVVGAHGFSNARSNVTAVGIGRQGAAGA